MQQRDCPSHTCVKAVKLLGQQLQTTARGTDERCCQRCKIAQVQTHDDGVIRRRLLYWLWLQNSKLAEKGGSTLSQS